MKFKHPSLRYCYEYRLPHEKTAAYKNAAVLIDALFEALDSASDPHGLTFSIIDADPIGDEVSRVTSQDFRLLYCIDRVGIIHTDEGFKAIVDNLSMNVGMSRWQKQLDGLQRIAQPNRFKS